MDPESVNWLSKLADFAWALTLIVGGGVIGAFVRLWRHEERLRTLESHHIDRTRQLSEIDRKIDANQHMTLGSIDKMRDDVRADIRMVISKLLDKVPSSG